MFKNIKLKRIENMKENSNLSIEYLKNKSEVLEEKNKYMEIEYESVLLENKNKIFSRLKSSGRLISLLALFSCVVSTVLSLIGGWELLNHELLKFSGYALVMLVCQLIIFVSSKYLTVIKNKFYHHYNSVNIMKNLMFLVSFCMNIIFFWECFKNVTLVIVMIPLCFVLDYSTIKFNSLGYDKKVLNFFYSKDGKTVFEMFVNNLVYEKVANIKNKYETNHKEILPINSKLKKARNSSEIAPSNEKPELKLITSNVNLEKKEAENKGLLKIKTPFEMYFEYIVANNNNGYVEGFKTIARKLSLSEGICKGIHKKLIDNNIITVENKKTKIVNFKNELEGMK